jgi:polysaccharide chain length determinant protein (PEP-CTERM system associated)
MQDIQRTFELVIGYIKGVWVKKRYIVICTWIICPIGFVKVASMPDVYESSARVYVDTRSVLQPMLKGLALQTDPRQEVAIMVQTLLSRPNLEIIARESDLDITTSDALQYEALINSLSNNIKLKAVGRDNLYVISYNHQNPEMAKTVVQETLDLFVEGTRGSSRRDSAAANQFIDEQIIEYEVRLSSSEQRLADFKRKYSDLLPNQGSFYTNYSSLEQDLEQTKLTIKETEQQIAALSNQINATKPSADGFAFRSSEAETGLTTRYDNRIETLEGNLDLLMLKYTELHPEVVEVNNLLDSLTRLREQDIEDYINSNTDTTGADRIGSIASALKLEMSKLKGQIASLMVREANFINKIDFFKQKIDLVPQVEAERTALNRDYQITQKKYLELLSRKEQSTLSQRADVSSEDVQFKVIDPPTTSQTPSGPNRLMSYSIVLLLGYAAGLGLAFVISQLNPILVKASQLTTLTSYPILGSVSHLNKAHILKIKRTRLMVFLLSSGIILGVYGMLIAAEIMRFNIYTRILS